MDVKEYFKNLNKQSQEIFNTSLEKETYLGLVHDFAISLRDWLKVIPESNPNMLISQAIEEIETSSLMLLGGFYRSAFASLRLSIEELFGAIFFHTDLLKFNEWKIGKGDLNWNTIIDIDNGILSKRYAHAFFDELTVKVNFYNTTSREIYRELSEFVHGNYTTWNLDDQKMKEDETLIIKYKEILEKYIMVAHFALSLRFLKHHVSLAERDILETHIMDVIGHEEEIRVFFGGQK